MTLPYPDIIHEDVTKITEAELRALGVSGLLLDIDGTLMQSRDAMPAKPVLDWMESMKAAGIKLYVLSNNKHEHRVARFCAAVGLDFQHLAKKPAKGGFYAAAKALGLSPCRVAVVGDQIYTDVLGAKRCGMPAILVESTDTYLFYFGIRRIFEKPFMKVRS